LLVAGYDYHKESVTIMVRQEEINRQRTHLVYAVLSSALWNSAAVFSSAVPSITDMIDKAADIPPTNAR